MPSAEENARQSSHLRGRLLAREHCFMVQAIPATSSLGVPARVDVSVKAQKLKMQCCKACREEVPREKQHELICCKAMHAMPFTSCKRLGRANDSTRQEKVRGDLRCPLVRIWRSVLG